MWTIDWLSRSEKIKRIYEVIWYKQKYLWNSCPRCWKKVFYENYWDSFWTGYDRLTCDNCWKLTFDEEESVEEKEYERVLPVLLWNVIEYANIIVSENSKNFDYTDEIEKVEKDILWLYINYTKQIEEQSDECVDYVYWLLDNPTETTTLW